MKFTTPTQAQLYVIWGSGKANLSEYISQGCVYQCWDVPGVGRVTGGYDMGSSWEIYTVPTGTTAEQVCAHDKG